jgi:uncharacterized membrane protein
MDHWRCPPVSRQPAVMHARYMGKGKPRQLRHADFLAPVAEEGVQVSSRHDSRSMHARRAPIHTPAHLGDRAADALAAFAGSWLFVGLHVTWFALWLLLRLDINLLTLIVSLEAIFLATFVLMNQNRQSEKDRARDNTEAQEVELLYQINQEQLEILRKLAEMQGEQIDPRRVRLERRERDW